MSVKQCIVYDSLKHIKAFFPENKKGIIGSTYATIGMFRACSGRVQGVFRVCSGHVRGIFGACSGHIRGMFGACSGHVWDMSGRFGGAGLGDI